MKMGFWINIVLVYGLKDQNQCSEKIRLFIGDTFFSLNVYIKVFDIRIMKRIKLMWSQLYSRTVMDRENFSVTAVESRKIKFKLAHSVSELILIQTGALRALGGNSLFFRFFHFNCN